MEWKSGRVMHVNVTPAIPIVHYIDQRKKCIVHFYSPICDGKLQSAKRCTTLTSFSNFFLHDEKLIFTNTGKKNTGKKVPIHIAAAAARPMRSGFCQSNNIF